MIIILYIYKIIKFSRMKYFFLIVTIIFFSCNEGVKQKTEKEKEIKVKPVIRNLKLIEEINKAFDTILIKNKFNGQILIEKDGEIIIEQCVGVTNIKDTNKIKPETQFHIASVSKTFTGMLTLKLHEEGKLNFKDSVTKYLPLFPYKNVTINQLLSHTSILPDYANFINIDKIDLLKILKRKDITALDKNETKYFNNQDILDFIIKFKPSPESNPKFEFHYCNTNYVILALIIEKITNQDFPTVLENYIFKKYDLKNTFVFNLKTIDKYIPSYKENNVQYGIEPFDLIYGDKNIYSTTRDLLKWDKILKSNDFLKKETLDIAYEPKSNLTKDLKTYGFGWRILVPKNEDKIIYHNGWWHGNNSAFVRLIKENAVVIILGNKYNNAIYADKPFIDILRKY